MLTLVSELTKEHKGAHVPEEVLRGRGYYSQKEDNRIKGIRNSGNTWCKMLATSEDDCCQEAYFLVGLNMSKDFKVNSIACAIRFVKDNNIHCGGFSLFIDNDSESETKKYEDMPIMTYAGFPDSVSEEIEKTIKGVHIPANFNFAGKKLPKILAQFIESSDNKRIGGYLWFGDGEIEEGIESFHTTIQSNEGQRYYSINICMSEDGIITDFRKGDTYNSTGSSMGDMFSRPVQSEGYESDSLQAMLFFRDLYEEDEML